MKNNNVRVEIKFLSVCVSFGICWNFFHAKNEFYSGLPYVFSSHFGTFNYFEIVKLKKNIEKNAFNAVKLIFYPSDRNFNGKFSFLLTFCRTHMYTGLFFWVLRGVGMLKYFYKHDSIFHGIRFYLSMLTLEGNIVRDR